MKRQSKAFICFVCEKRYAELEDAEVCERSHDRPEPERDEAYERAAARDRADGFARTGGKDWT